MAGYGRPPPTSPRSKQTTPTSKTSVTDTLSDSPFSGFASPLSAASNFSFSPSTAFLSLAGATATTPLSSIDGGDTDCTSSASGSSSKMSNGHEAHYPIYAPVDEAVSPRSQKSQVAPAFSRLSAHSVHPAPGPVDAVATSATNTATMTKTTAQSTTPTPIRGPGAVADRGHKQDNTRSKTQKHSIDNSSSSSSNDTSAIDSILSSIKPLDAATPGCATSNFAPASAAPSLAPRTKGTTSTAGTASTTGTTGTSNSPAITSDLIRRVSSSRSIAHSAASSSPRALRPAPTLITTITTIVQPKATRPPPSPHQQQLPPFARSASSHSGVSLRQTLSHSVAQLEETAEQFSSTGSIETAIREAHQELKRSDSRRSSLAQSRRDFSRQSSIIGLNSAARAGAYTPNNYIMSPTSSVAGVGSAAPGDDTFPALSRHGTNSSVRSVQSGKQSLPEIVEFEPPMTITQDALDEADRRIAAGEDREEHDTILAGAHQTIEEDHRAHVYDKDELHFGNYASSSSPDTDSGLLSTQSPPSMARPSVTDYLGLSSTQQYEPVSTTYPEHDPSSQIVQGHTQEPETHAAESAADIVRPATSGSGGTYHQAQTAFQDFDGVHCDPDNASIKQPPSIPNPADEAPQRQSQLRYALPTHAPQLPDDLTRTPSPGYKPRAPPVARPTSYLDPSTGQQMLFYPARVPAMLNLPPKLSKNPKAAERNARRSQVLSMMQQNNEPKPERESRVWLPDPITGDMGSPFMNPLSTGEASPSLSQHPRSAAGSGPGDGSKSTSMVSVALDADAAADADSGPKTGSTGRPDMGQLRRPPRILDADKRKSRMSTLSKLPPQLRASAFFDSPSRTANIELKNGSASDTLDSILDASASAPVSAFTDHAFAGHLGSETYGTEKRRTKKPAASNTRNNLAVPQAAPPHELRTSKSRSSFMSIVGLGHIRKVSDTMDSEGRAVPRPRRRLSKTFNGAVISPGLSDGGNLMAPGDDERPSDEDDENDHLQGRLEDGEEEYDDEEDEEEDEYDDLAYHGGAPTTLLAELQLRKQQQKLRTRPINKAFPNGMHSTLLELDLVAEIERKARKGKKVNLAWEDPALRNGNDDSDDEDVPLGMLYAAKAAGHNDISAIAAEINRPLGLMEKKEMEDNEPLSRRRDRLQGRDAGPSMYLRPSYSTNALGRQGLLTKTPSIMALNRSISPNASNPQSMTAPEDAGKDADAGPVVEEVEDEPLAARRLRMKAKEESELPRARVVSMAFSEELLGQFADPEEEAAKEREKKEKMAKANNALPSEEEETLGQRRRRLQAEKEAREQEMGSLALGFGPGPAVNNQALDALTGGSSPTTPGRLTRRLSMADVLAAHPVGLASTQGQNPRDAERIRREQEVARATYERDHKMAAMRAQMSHSNTFASMSGGANKAGGFLGGRFNDGAGGITGQTHTPVPQLYGQMGNPGMGNPGMNSMSRNTMYSGYGGISQPNLLGNAGMMPNNGMAMGGGYGAAGTMFNGFNGMGGMQQMPMHQMQMPMQQMQMPMGVGGQMQMPMQIPGQPPQIDRVERWRQSILP